MNHVPAEKELRKRLKYIKKTLKEKIAIYKPLKYSTAYNRFIEWVQDGEFNDIEEIPGNCKAKWCLKVLIKIFLIREAYYVLGEKYIRQRLMSRLGIFEENDIQLLEIVDYIMERLERNGMEKLKKFKEKCQFKTFLSLLTVSLLMDLWRKKYREKKSAIKYETDFEDLFNPEAEDPLEMMIGAEVKKMKNQAAHVLPQILERLNPEEKIIYQLKYEMDIKKISEIARRLGYNRYKTKQAIKQLERKIKIEIFSEGVDPLFFTYCEGKSTNHEDEVCQKTIFQKVLIKGGNHESS